MTGHTLFDPSLSSRLCLTLLHSLWQVALLALVARLTSLPFRKRSLEFEYSLHLGALLAASLALPITFALVDVPTVNVAIADPALSGSTAATLRSPKSAGDAALIGRKVVHSDSPISGSPPARSNLAHNDQRALWLKMAPWFVGLYAVGVLIMLIRLGAAIIRVERLRNQSHRVTTGGLVESLSSFARQWSLRKAPTLAQVESIVLPRVIGLLRPMILIPAAATSGLSAKELEMILVHELAHVRRYDLWANLLQRLVEVALFFNPAAWYLSRKISALREHCCDEMTCRALAGTEAEPRLQYVTALLRVVELTVPVNARHADLTALAMGGRSRSELRRRVARILNEPLDDPIRFSRGGVLALAAVALLATCGPLLTRTDAQTSDPKTASVTAIEKEDAAATEVFSFGSKLELLAIGTHDSPPQKWWDVRGRPLDTVPFTWKNAGNANARDVRYRKIVFQIHDYPEDAHINWSIPQCHASAGGTVVIDGKQPPGYFARYFGVPEDCKTAGLKVGVATGPWTTVASANGSSAFGSNDLSIVFSEPVQTATETLVIVSHNCFDRDFQVVAVDKQGKTHTQTEYGGASAGKIYQSKAGFPKLTRADIDHFEFQVRDYEWIEFEDLPLDPMPR